MRRCVEAASRIVALCALFAAMTADSGVAAAQSIPAADDISRRAVELAERARAAYADDDLLGAIVLYEEAFDLTRDPAFAYNLGALYDVLGDLPRAHLYYSGYLQLYPDAPNRAAVEGEITRLLRSLELGYARVVVEASPHDAEVFALRAGRSYLLGTAPIEGYFDPGPLTLQVTRRGYTTRTLSLALDEGSQTTTTVALAPQSHRLRRLAYLCEAGANLSPCRTNE
jgi:tetratricopeptide (TPR) repeat protein